LVTFRADPVDDTLIANNRMSVHLKNDRTIFGIPGSGGCVMRPYDRSTVTIEHAHRRSAAGAIEIEVLGIHWTIQEPKFPRRFRSQRSHARTARYGCHGAIAAEDSWAILEGDVRAALAAFGDDVKEQLCVTLVRRQVA
jgi:hypothetical protein